MPNATTPQSEERALRSQQRKLRRRVRAELRALDAPAPLELAWLCERLGERRGRPIRVTPSALPVPGPFGLWIATDDEDVILYQSQTTPSHQNHIILHEVGHILAGHSSNDPEPTDASEEPEDELVEDLLPDLPSGMVQNALRRESYNDGHEQEAELVASIILEWSSKVGLTSPPTPDDALARRAQEALGDHQGWL